MTVDVAAPPPALGVRHHALDFTEPASDQRLLELLREEEVETVVHAAFFTNPRRDTGYAHELESIGTLNLLAAAAAAGVQRVILRSFTAVYGARGHNPNFLTEDHPLQPEPVAGLGPRQAGGGAARGRLRPPLSRRCRSRCCASRPCSGPASTRSTRASSTIAWCRC